MCYYKFCVDLHGNAGDWSNCKGIAIWDCMAYV